MTFPRSYEPGYSRRKTAITSWVVAILSVTVVIAYLTFGLAAMGHAAEPPKPAATPIAVAATAKAPEFRVNLNVADTTQLGLIPGIGPAKAKAIVAYRAGKSFQTTADLMKVKGIGPKMYAQLKPWLAVDGPAVIGTPPKGKRPGT